MEEYDAKFDLAARFDRSYFQLLNGLKTKNKKILGVAAAFRSNMSVVEAIADFPIHAAFFSSLFERIRCKAEQDTVNSISLSGPYEGNTKHTEAQLDAMVVRMREITMEYGHKWDGKESMLTAFAEGVRNTQLKQLIIRSILAPGSSINPGIQSILSLMLTSVWTAFETLAGDLLVETVNDHPAGSAELRGYARRISKLAGGSHARDRDDDFSDGETPQSAAEEKKISLASIQKITRGSCNLRRRMGNLLRDSGAFKFISLRGIRRAYSQVFYKKYDSIDQILASKSLDSLSAVRNLIVHKAGVADEKYCDDINGTDAPKLELGARLVPDGELVLRLVSPVIQASTSLVMAVDEWLSEGKNNKDAREAH